jgi:hypothetical protein
MIDQREDRPKTETPLCRSFGEIHAHEESFDDKTLEKSDTWLRRRTIRAAHL